VGRKQSLRVNGHFETNVEWSGIMGDNNKEREAGILSKRLDKRESDEVSVDERDIGLNEAEPFKLEDMERDRIKYEDKEEYYESEIK